MVVLFPIRKEWHNAPLVIAKFFAVLSVYSLLFSIVITGRSVAKDFSARIHEFFFTLPITKTSFLGGRFFAGFSANLLIFTGVIVGLLLGSLLIDSKFSGPFSLTAFIKPIVFILIPNILFTGAIFFSFATLSRKMVMTYVSGVILLMLYGFLSLGLLFVDSDTIKILIDPFAISSLNTITENWTVSEINNNPMPLTGLFLLNRIIWLSVSGIVLFLTWKKFRMISFLENSMQKNFKNVIENESLDINVSEPLIVSTTNYSLSAQIFKCMSLVKKEFTRVVFHPAFIILTIMSSLTIFMNFYMNVNFGGDNVYPTTSWYLQQSQSILGYTIPMIIFFGGVIVWRERDYNSNQIFDTLPIPDWVGYISKLFALFSILFFYMFLIMFTGVFTQVFILNWTDIELGLYIRWLFGIEMLYYWFLSVLVLFILNLAKNKYLGFFICVLFIAADIIIFITLRSELSILRYGHVPSFIYSDINGFGHYSELILWYSLHWIVIATLLGIITLLTWRSSEEVDLKFRLRSFYSNTNNPQKFIVIILLLIVTTTTTYISYNKYSLNNYISHDDQIEMKADYEKNYSKFKNVPQPSLYHVDLNVDFYPEECDAFIRGMFLLKNKTGNPIDSIFMNLPKRKISKINLLEFSEPNKLIYEGSEFGFRIFKLKEPLLPGDEIKLSFDLEAQTLGFSDNNPKNELVENGSRINLTLWGANEYFPTIGFDDDFMLESKINRKKHNLPMINKYPEPENYLQEHQMSSNPYITYNAVISTSESQTAITNGNLVKNWIEENRNYFHYKSDVPMQCEIQIVSGEYEIVKEKQNNVSIEVYYNKKHPWNVERIIRGAKASLEYCSTNFINYPYSTFKVVEIPKYMKKGGAREQPTLIVWREDVGFLSQVDDADGIDQLFGITAHELTHNWWPDIVIPANASGLEMMAEAIAEYVRIMCIEKEYGKEMAHKHLKREMDKYLSARSRDLDGERPFKYANPNQYYINYQKGTAAMYALQNFISEDRVNLALRRITEKYGFSESIHPTSLDLIAEYRKVAPDSMQYLITDLFEKITLYENKVESVSAKKLADNRYSVMLEVTSQKYYADSIGNETKQSLNDFVDIGVLGEGGKELYLQKHKFTDERKILEIIVDEKPFKAGIDPYVILIDRNRENNLVDID